MSNLYQLGLQVDRLRRDTTRRDMRVAGDDKPTEQMSPIKVLVITALAGLATWFIFFRKRERVYVGPDTSDIKAKIRARGLDPHKYGI